MFDNEENFDPAAYELNLKIVTEFLAKLCFPQIKREEKYLSDDVTLVNFNNQTQFISYLSQNPRIPTQLVTDSKISQELVRQMKLNLKNTKVRKIKVNNPKFYEDTPVVQKMKYSRAESQMIDLVLLAGILAYLTAVYYLFGTRAEDSKVKTE